jgi:superfamily II DNA or RNA helicase
MALLSELFMHEKPLRTGATAVYPYSPKLERLYKFTSRFGEEVPLCRVDLTNSEIHLPRAICQAGGVDQRVVGEPVSFPKTPSPRPHQVKLFNEVAAFLKAGQSGVACAYTGFGKTVVGFHAACAVGRKTLVITTKEDIYKQWIDGAKKFLGLDHVGQIRADTCDVEPPFVVAMIHSLSKEGRYPKWITKGFGLVIFDECHRVPAEQFSTVADMFPAKLRLGLSATPDRADGKELLLYAHIGPIRAKTEAQLMVPKVLRFHSAWQCPRVMRTDPETCERRVGRLPHQPGKTAHVEKSIAADNVRNHMIAGLVKQGLEKGRKIVVFSTQLDHLKAMHRACTEAFEISGRDMAFYVGESTKADKERRDRDKVKPVLFATYGMMSEGTDIPWLDLCILAMPRANVAQSVGRIRREYPDKPMPVVMDIVDNDSPVFAGYAGSRAKWFRSIGAEVKDMT